MSSVRTTAGQNGTEDAGRRILTGATLEKLGTNQLVSVLLEEAARNEALSAKLQSRLDARGIEAAAGSPAAGSPSADEPYMVGSSPAMRQVFENIRKFSRTDSIVLIRGESGTGKELAALAIHERSAYAKGPFISVNCAGLPEHLIASELFGHEKGSFTGANGRRIGRFEAANGGTLFLDEIGDLPLQLQGHFLRVLQSKTIERIGRNDPIPIDVQIIAATNVDLQKAVKKGIFREDLYYRLNVLTLFLPPLRERKGDMELLANYFLRLFSEEMKVKIDGFDEAVMKAFRTYPWPGNIRELISVIRRGVVMANGRTITLRDIHLSPAWRSVDGGSDGGSGADAGGDPVMTLEAARNAAEAAVIRKALAAARGQLKQAAAYLGVSRVTLYRLMEKHGIAGTGWTA